MGLNEYGKIVKEFIIAIPDRYQNVHLDYFVIMPNHIHAIIVIAGNVGAIHELPLRHKPALNHRIYRRSMLLPKIIGWLKMNSSKQINQTRNTTVRPIWQRNYYERVIRNEIELNKIRQYIQNNPQQWDLDSENPVNIKP